MRHIKLGLLWDSDIGLGLGKSIHFTFTGVNYPNYAKDFSFHSLTLPVRADYALSAYFSRYLTWEIMQGSIFRDTSSNPKFQNIESLDWDESNLLNDFTIMMLLTSFTRKLRTSTVKRFADLCNIFIGIRSPNSFFVVVILSSVDVEVP